MSPLFKYKYEGEWHSSPLEDKPEEVAYTKDGEKLSENKALYRNSIFAQQFWFSVLNFIPNFDLPFYPQIIEKWDVFYHTNKKKRSSLSDYVQYDYTYEETDYGSVAASRTVTYSGTLRLSIDDLSGMWDEAEQDEDIFQDLIAEYCSDQVNDDYSSGDRDYGDLEIDDYEFECNNCEFNDRTIETPDASTIIQEYFE
tara:strand:+ start:3511 stop:4104 length:594 start_codon:yes stop_codon:yes gene_type:complete